MDDESKKLLESTFELAKENNDMLRTMRRSQRISLAIKVFYWTLIIGLALGSFYFLQPYVDSLQEAYSSSKSTIDQFKSFGN